MRPMWTLTITATSSMYESSIHWYPHLTSSNIEVKTVCISHNFPWYTVSAHTAIILNLILCAYVAQSPRRAVWGPRCGYNTRAWAERACDTVSCQYYYLDLYLLLLFSVVSNQYRKYLCISIYLHYTEHWFILADNWQHNDDITVSVELLLRWPAAAARPGVTSHSAPDTSH